jgi:two-component system KDP operon response regulator KdpE
VDDEPPILRLLSATLRANDFAVVTASNGAEAIATFSEHHPDLILLDVMMPDMDGHEVLRSIRQSSSVPVIMLTARTADNEKVQALLSGADDYITKPFHPDELIARITAVLRRSHGPTPTTPVELHYNTLKIDLGKRYISRGDEEIRLSRTEWALLELLATNTGRVMLHGDLLSRIWGPEFRDEVYYLRTWISRLRRKLGVDSDELITTMPGIGYRMAEPDPQPST